jgi:hypothetical protein
MCSRPRAVSAIRYFASYASCSRRSSSFSICIIASTTRFAVAGSPPPPSRLPSFFGMICPCVERHELLAFELVLDRHHLSVCAVNGQHPRPREDGGVVLHRLFGLRVEPEKWRDGQHGRLPVEFVGRWSFPAFASKSEPIPEFLHRAEGLTEETTQGVRPRPAAGGRRPPCQVDRMRLQPASCAKSVANTPVGMSVAPGTRLALMSS